MTGIGVEISAEKMEMVKAILSGVPKGAERAYANAINRGLSRVKTAARKEVQQVYAVQSKAFTEATRTRMQTAGTGALAGYIIFSGAKIPLYKFKATPKQPGTGRTVKAGQMKGGSGEVFEHAFIARMKTGHTGIFERKDKQGNETKKYPIKEAMGDSAAQMIGNADVTEALEKEAQRVVDERLEHEIERILNGYGR